MSTDDFFERRKKQLSGGSGDNLDSFFESRKKQLAPLSKSQQHALEVEQSDMAQMDAFYRTNNEPEPSFIDNLAKTFKPEINAIKNIPNFVSTLARTAKDELTKPGEIVMNSEELPGRDAPVIGPVLRGADAVANNRIVQNVGELGREFFIPGATMQNIAGMTRATESALTRLAPKLNTTLGGKAVKGAITEASVGFPLATGQSLTQGNTLDEALKDGVIGAALGAGIGAAAPALRKGVQSARNASSRSLGESVERGNTTASRASQSAETVEPIKQNWFSRLFGEQEGVGFTPFKSNKSNRMVSTEQQIVKNPLISDVKGAAESVKKSGRAIYQNMVDYLSPLKTINRQTYDSAMDASRASNIANTIVRDKFVDNQGNVIGHSLDEVMRSVRGLGKILDDYLVLRHAVTRMKRGERVYDEALAMTPEKAAKQVEILEQRYPQLKQAGQMWDQFNENLLRSGVQEGLITEEAFKAMRAENPHYASMRRQFTIGEKLAQPKFGGTGSSFSGQNAPINSVSPTGSTRKIVSPIRTAIEQVYAWKNAELRNRTMQEIVKAIQRDPQGMSDIVEIVKKPSTSYKSLDEALRKGGTEEFIEQLDNDFRSLFRPHKPGEENIVRAMINGSPVYLRVKNPEAVKALLGMGADQSGIVLDALQKFSNATKRGATGLFAPLFSVKNLTADTVQAAIQSPNAIMHVAVDLPYAVISSIADALGIPGLRNLAQDFRRSGGEYSALLRGDRPVNRSVFELRKEAPLSPRGVVKGALLAGKFPFRVLEKVSDITENANRIAAFRRAMIGKERTPENVRAAINAARESTTNFSRRGANSRELEAAIPYSNAAMQGMYRISRAIVKNPVKTMAGVTSLVIAPKLYEYARFNNDPDYQKLPARERYRNLIVSKNDDGTFVKLPMPPEYAAFGALFLDVLNDVVHDKPDAYKGTLDALANAWLPPAASGLLQGATQGGGVDQSMAGFFNSTVAAPYAAIMSNKSFTGAPIESKAVEDRSPQNRYDEKTSGVAKKLGEITGYSPMKIDYLMRAYGGDIARLILPLTSDVGAGTPRNTLLRNFIVDPTLTNNLSNDFYTAKQRMTQAYRDNQEVGAPLPKWFDENLYQQLNSRAKGSITKQLEALNDEKKQINGDKSLSAEQKAQRLREVQRRMNDIYADMNTKLYQKGVPMR